MKIQYQEKRFARKSLDIIERAEAIMDEYTGQGFDLTLRQLYYQFVARGLLENSQKSYKRLGSIINDARLAGMLSWTTIVDRTRSLKGLAHWNSPASIIESSAYSYREQKWSDQPVRIEAWIEKDALIGVISGVCNELEIDFFSCRGYTSQSEIWKAARRFKRYNDRGQRVIVLHLGDHDPSGIDMTRDIRDRLAMFGADVEVRRIALTHAQVLHYAPPPNPAKLTDSRAADYVAQYGYESWELDALEPDVMSNLIRDEVLDERDEDLWEAALDHERGQKAVLSQCAERWEEVVRYLGE